MTAGTINVPIQKHRLGVVEQQLLRDAAEVVECIDQTGLPSLERFALAKLDVRRPAVAQARHEGHQPIPAAPDGREVGLHLPARRRLETHHRLLLGLPHRRHQHLQLADAAGVAPIPQLPKQNRRRDHVRLRGLQPLADVVHERIQLAGASTPGPVTRCGTAQIPPDRVPRHPQFPGNLPDPFALTGQYLDLHRLLLAQHSGDLQKVAILAGVGQFYFGDSGSVFSRR